MAYLETIRASMSSNIYTPLRRATKDIRLLTLIYHKELHDDSPIYANGQIRGELHTVSLDTNPEYEALSYVWGPPCDDDYSIIVNGNRVRVRYNLLLALNALQARASNKSDRRTFWIDALCINQNDLSEREQQVQIMGQIYASSRQVVAWLGPREDGVSVGVAAGVSLLNSEYWSRLWIIQEICLAPSLQILHGTESYGWWEFLELIQNIPSVDKVTKENLGRIQRFHGTLRLYPSYDARERNLIGMLNISRDRLCQDPRDKLYGILSLAYDLKNSELLVSYSISLFELFCSVVGQIKFERGREGRKLLGRFGDLQDPDLFSWDVVEFCQSFQLSLLDSSFGEAVHREMQVSRRSGFEKPTTKVMTTWANTRIWLGGRCSGKILMVAHSYEELLNMLILEKSVGPEFKISCKWHVAMKTIWELDHSSFVGFAYNDSKTSAVVDDKSWSLGPDRMDTGIEIPLTRPGATGSESRDALILFLTTELEIGLAPSGTMRGDNLWTYETHSWNSARSVHAIVRKQKDDRVMIHGRALLADVIPWMVDKADLHDDPAAEKDLKGARGNDIDMAVYADLAQLQVLTCPLRSEYVAVKN